MKKSIIAAFDSLFGAINKELLYYLVFGILTTAVNFLSYIVLTKLFFADFKTATTVAWFLSVFFAFVTNKIYVFRSRQTNPMALTREFASFLFSRVLSYGLDIMTMILLVSLLRMNDLVAKIIANILVIVFNYLASKFFVFKDNRG